MACRKTIEAAAPMVCLPVVSPAFTLFEVAGNDAFATTGINAIAEITATRKSPP
jgi:hypothetical protein